MRKELGLVPGRRFSALGSLWDTALPYDLSPLRESKKMSYFHFVYLSLDSRFLTCWARNYICCTFLLTSSPLLLPSSVLPSPVSSPPPLGSTSALWPCGRYCPDWSVSFLVGSRQGLDWALGGEVCCPRACLSRELSCLSCVAFGHSRVGSSSHCEWYNLALGWHMPQFLHLYRGWQNFV